MLKQLARVAWVAVLFGLACGGAKPGPKEAWPAPAPGQPVVAVSMRALAEDVWTLDALLSDWPEDVVDDAAVMQTLADFERTLASLREDSLVDGHRALRDALEHLRSEARLAFEQATESPPDYTMARALIGACTHCHTLTDPAFREGEGREAEEVTNHHASFDPSTKQRSFE